MQIVDNKAAGTVEIFQLHKRTVFMKFEFDMAVEAYFDKQGYDIVKREPKTLLCPNPECGMPVSLQSYPVSRADDSYYMACQECEYQSPHADTPAEAARLHTLIADNPLPRKPKISSERMVELLRGEGE